MKLNEKRKAQNASQKNCGRFFVHCFAILFVMVDARECASFNFGKKIRANKMCVMEKIVRCEFFFKTVRTILRFSISAK